MDSMSSQTQESASAADQHYYKETFDPGRIARAYGAQLGILGVFLSLWIIFIVSAPDTFLSSRIYFAFMSTIPFFSFIYDATASLASVPTRVFLAFIAALVSGSLIGWLNGLIIVKFRIPSLVATIGTQFFWRGAVLVLTEGKNYSLSYIKESFLYPALVGKIGGYFPMQMLWLIIIALVCWVLLNRHRFGAHIYLIGDNVQSAQLMGVNTGRVRIQAFMLVGLISAFAGVLYSFHIAYFWPSTGEGYLLSTLASVFLGGTSVFGGTGTILGTFLGAFIIGTIEAGTVAVGLTGFLTQLIYGLIIVLSVIMHTYLRKQTE